MTGAVLRGWNRSLNWAAVISVGLIVWMIGSAWTLGVASAKARPAPRTKAGVNLFIANDLPGLIRRVRPIDGPLACESLRNSPAGERLRAGPGGGPFRAEHWRGRVLPSDEEKRDGRTSEPHSQGPEPAVRSEPGRSISRAGG